MSMNAMQVDAKRGSFQRLPDSERAHDARPWAVRFIFDPVLAQLGIRIRTPEGSGSGI
jgi:hypothetical protein